MYGYDVQGQPPPVQDALDLYHILSESDTDLRQPVGLEKQLLQDNSLDADVGQSMLQLLQVIQYNDCSGCLLTNGLLYCWWLLQVIAPPVHQLVWCERLGSPCSWAKL